MKTKLYPKTILKFLPVKYYLVDRITKKNRETRSAKYRLQQNNYYSTKKIACISNYRNTSKLIDFTK